MRFSEGGPDIPDELLIARDEGRVIFFCGAGVSRARAALPDFFGLAREVTDILGVSDNSKAKRLIAEAREIATRLGEGGLISADRVFGLLEREFTVADIHSAVAKALTPQINVDLSAHRVMLDLASGPDGKIRLVTTNFDRLFESCDDSIACWQHPRFPDLLRHEDFNGVVHLHGRVNASYTGSEGDGFILSSSEFGRAYLSDAWATAFIQTILDKYLVVFVGYTADDPPVQYLLEALTRSPERRSAVFAFQAGDQSDAQAKWLHKGVQPIAYEEEEGHRILWDTLTAWSHRARDVEAWYQGIVSLAQRGPEFLEPHQRGQFAHVASTLDGVRRFSSADPSPPAEWLCVFDPTVRYSSPRHEFRAAEDAPFVDPFSLYGLDSDKTPPRIDAQDHFTKREVPTDAWDCFALTRLERQDISSKNLPALRGYLSIHIPVLPPRLWQLGIWLQKVSTQPAAVWWAAHQTGLHPAVQMQIRYELKRAGASTSEGIRKAWRYIFESWAEVRNDPHHDWFELEASIALEGWTSAAIRGLASILKPYLTAEKPFGSPRPPSRFDDVTKREIVRLDIQYPHLSENIQIPDEYLQLAVREIRKNLEWTVLMERELGGYGLTDLVPIEPDPNLGGESTGRSFGIAIPILFYVDQFKKLLDANVKAARQEFTTWWAEDEGVFARLRIWACGDSRLLSSEDSGNLVTSLTDLTFWNGQHQRDFLLVLERRWSEFSPAIQTKLASRLLAGPPRWEHEKEPSYIERRAWSSLNRIYWLNEHGCTFSFDLEAETAKLKILAPKWDSRHGSKAAESMEGRSGSVTRDQEFESLLSIPLESVLAKAAQLSGRNWERFVESDPFSGLVSKRPIRAISALTLSGRRGEFPEWAWRTFLSADARKEDKPKLSALIAERISRIPIVSQGSFIYAITDWLHKASKVLLVRYPRQFEKVWKSVLLVVRADNEATRSTIVRGNKKPNWATEALNSPVGKLAQAVMNDPQQKDLKVGEGFPTSWIGRVEELLSLENDPRRYALVMLSYNLSWFYAIDPMWSEKHILSALESEDEDQAAVWEGFFWHATVPPEPLYLRMKARLLGLAKGAALSRRGHVEVLSAIILAGWGNTNSKTGNRNVTDAEVREVLIQSDEAFRLNILWQLERWSKGEKCWLDRVPTFLSNVWPRQKTVKSPKLSARLCELALSNLEILPAVADIALPLLTKATDERLFFHDLSLKGGVVDMHPEQTLMLLSALLPDDTSTWPYQIDEVLERIGLVSPTLLKDPRLVELRRKWNSR